MINITAAVLLAIPVGDVAADSPADCVKVPSVLIKLIEQVDVPAQEAGVLEKVEVKEGRRVKDGDLLAVVDQTKSNLAVERARTEMEIALRRAKNDINVRFAKSALKVAEAELRRAQESNEKYPGSVTNSELDRLKLTVEKSQLEVEQAQHEFEIAAETQRIKKNDYDVAVEDVRRRQIVSSLDGVVVQVNRRRGEWVEAGDKVMRILGTNPLRAEGFVKAEDLKHDLQDRPVTLHVKLPDGTAAKFPGQVVFIDPEIDPVNAQSRVWAEVKNDDLKLRPGMRADMFIDVAE
jgi:RND family efflux transporter MFP subunit